MKIVVENTVETLKRRVLQKLNEWQVVTEEETSELTAIFSDEGTVNPFKDLGTLYRQEKFIEKNFNYVVSIAQHFAELASTWLLCSHWVEVHSKLVRHPQALHHWCQPGGLMKSN